MRLPKTLVKLIVRNLVWGWMYAHTMLNRIPDKTWQRALIDYFTIISDVEISETEIDDVELNSVSSLSTSESTTNQPTTSNIFLLPKNTSNKNKQKLKKKQLSGARNKK